MAEQPDLFAPPAQLLEPRVREAVLRLLFSFAHPSAWELVEQILRQVGLKGFHESHYGQPGAALMTRLWMLFKVPFHYVSDLLPGHGNWDTSKMIPEITFSAEVFEYVPYSVRVSGT